MQVKGALNPRLKYPASISKVRKSCPDVFLRGCSHGCSDYVELVKSRLGSFRRWFSIGGGHSIDGDTLSNSVAVLVTR